MLNVIILMGRLTRDPQIFSKEESIDVVNFDIAVDNIGQDAGTSFFTCKTFGKIAVNVNNYCKKGSKVAVNGRIQQRTYLAKDGSKRSTYEVICDSVEFLDPKPVEEPKPEPTFEEPQEPEPTFEEPQEPEPVQEPKYDPMTGKPLKPSKK